MNSKIHYHTTKLWAFWCMWSLLSLSALFVTQLYFFLHVSRLSFKIQILSFHMIAYFFSFDLPIWTPKSDIIRGIYELFDACGHSCLSLPYLWYNFTFSFMSLGPNLKIQSGKWIVSYLGCARLKTLLVPLCMHKIASRP